MEALELAEAGSEVGETKGSLAEEEVGDILAAVAALQIKTTLAPAEAEVVGLMILQGLIQGRRPIQELVMLQLQNSSKSQRPPARQTEPRQYCSILHPA
jgi:hypothetical protein